MWGVCAHARSCAQIVHELHMCVGGAIGPLGVRVWAYVGSMWGVLGVIDLGVLPWGLHCGVVLGSKFLTISIGSRIIFPTESSHFPLSKYGYHIPYLCGDPV